MKSNIKSPCEIFVCDIADHLAVDAMLAEIKASNITIDVLINNAGVSQRGLAFETDFMVDEQIMKVNYFGTVYLTKKVLPSMMENKKGKIIVISSVAGKYGFWQRSAYAASKHALHGFFETLQIELKEYNIDTLLVCPGGVKTNMSKNALAKDGTPHGKMDAMQHNGLRPEDLAIKILNASEARKKQILVGRGEVFLYYIKKWWPSLFFRIVARVKERR